MVQVIPDSWRIVELREIATLIGGGTPSRKHQAFFQGEIPWVTGADLSEDNIAWIEEAREYITNEAIEASATNKVPAESVLITTRVNVGKVAITKTPLCFSQDITAIRVKNAKIADFQFLAYFFLANRERILRFNRGTTISGLRKNDLARFPIPLPTLQEQHEIVKILRQADRLCLLRAKSSQLINKLPNALFFDLFLRDSEKLSGWGKVKLGSIAPMITSGQRNWGQYYAGKGARFIRVQDIQNGMIISDDPAFVALPSFPDKDRVRIVPNDLLITITGTIGRVAVAPTELSEAYVSQHVAIVRLDSVSPLSPNYISAYLNHPLGGQGAIQKMNYGQTKPGLNLNQIQSIRIPKPPLDLIDRFETELKNVQDVYTASQQSMIQHNVMRLSLMSKAFVGKLTYRYRDNFVEVLTAEIEEREQILQRLHQGNDAEPADMVVSKHAFVEKNLGVSQKRILEFIRKNENYSTLSTLENLNDLPSNEIHRNLNLLAELGLIKVVSMPVAPGKAGRIFFTKVYRCLNSKDNFRDADLADLSEI